MNLPTRGIHFMNLPPCHFHSLSTRERDAFLPWSLYTHNLYTWRTWFKTHLLNVSILKTRDLAFYNADTRLWYWARPWPFLLWFYGFQDYSFRTTFIQPFILPLVSYTEEKNFYCCRFTTFRCAHHLLPYLLVLLNFSVPGVSNSGEITAGTTPYAGSVALPEFMVVFTTGISDVALYTVRSWFGASYILPTTLWL